jgi:hypothetical protein
MERMESKRRERMSKEEENENIILEKRRKGLREKER